MTNKPYVDYAFQYVGAWVLIFFLFLLLGWQPSNQDILFFFGGFVGVPFATFYKSCSFLSKDIP
jgi:hypothetical protein